MTIKYMEKLEEIATLKQCYAEKQRSCAVCSMRLTESEMTNHLCHERVGAINCEYCPKSFQSTIGLREHLETYHDDNKQFHKCDKCSRIFDMALLFEYHMESCHEDGVSCTSTPEIEVVLVEPETTTAEQENINAESLSVAESTIAKSVELNENILKRNRLVS